MDNCNAQMHLIVGLHSLKLKIYFDWRSAHSFHQSSTDLLHLLFQCSIQLRNNDIFRRKNFSITSQSLSEIMVRNQRPKSTFEQQHCRSPMENQWRKYDYYLILHGKCVAQIMNSLFAGQLNSCVHSPYRRGSFARSSRIAFTSKRFEYVIPAEILKMVRSTQCGHALTLRLQAPFIADCGEHSLYTLSYTKNEHMGA